MCICYVSACVSFVDDFNEGLILPTLIRQLKSILDQYPDDGQILKVGLCALLSLKLSAQLRQNYYDKTVACCYFVVDLS